MHQLIAGILNILFVDVKAINCHSPSTLICAILVGIYVGSKIWGPAKINQGMFCCVKGVCKD